MKSYFLANLTSIEVVKLAENGVESSKMSINDEVGVVIDEDFFEKALSVLAKKVTNESKTEYEGLYRVTLVPAVDSTRHCVRIETWDGENKQAFKAIIEEVLLPITKKNIIVYVPHGHSHTLSLGENEFYIAIWSSPAGDRCEVPPENLWGHKVSCRDSAFISTGQGFQIVDPETDYAVAELIENCLYIHHDICHHGDNYEFAIFRHILGAVVEELCISPKKRLARSLREREIKRAAYVTECNRGFQERVSSLQNSLQEIKNDIEKYQLKLVKAIRLASETQVILGSLQEKNSNSEDKYAVQYDELFKIDSIRDIFISTNIISCITDVLFCTDPRSGKKHEIGAFRINIYLDGSEHCVRWFNRTRRVDGCKSGMQAPHVFPNGNACLGNMEEVFPELVANYEFTSLILMAIQFIETVNVNDDAGKYIDRWPLAKNIKKNLRKKGEAE